MSEKRLFGLIGIAEKAGKTASGEFAAEQALKAGKACLLILAEDASANTQKKFRDLCERVRCPLAVFGSKTELAHAIGKEERACVAILDQGLAAAIGQSAEGFKRNQGE